MLMKRILLTVAVLIAVLAVSCRNGESSTKTNQNATEQKTDETPWYADMEALEADLAAAIDDAKQLDSSKIVNDLMPIRKDYPGQEWATFDGHDMVLCVTLVNSSRMERFFGRDDLYRIDREMGTWISLPADWKNHKADFEGLASVAAHMRLIQLYGLSPDCDYNIMVEFYADPAGIFRPAHDPDITTTTVGLEFPPSANESLVIGETNFREWYRYSVSAAYEDDSPLPWTQLGYTYDWHKGAPRKGLSEYIVSHHTQVKVKRCLTEWQFIQSVLN